MDKVKIVIAVWKKPNGAKAVVVEGYQQGYVLLDTQLLTVKARIKLYLIREYAEQNDMTYEQALQAIEFTVLEEVK